MVETFGRRNHGNQEHSQGEVQRWEKARGARQGTALGTSGGCEVQAKAI